MKVAQNLAVSMLLASLALTACKKTDHSAEVYEQVAASAGIGVAFGASPDQVRAKLGEPTQTIERGKLVEDYYVTVPPGTKAPEMPNLEYPQLTVAYYDKEMIKVFNSYHPEQPGAASPPYVAQPLTGIKLGLKRSEIEKLLGPPNHGALNDGWRYVGEEGSSVILQPQYTMVEGMGDRIVSALAIEHAGPSSDLGKGEYYDKKKKRQEAIHNLTTK